LPASEIRDNQRVLKDLALRVTAADPRQIVESCFQYPCGLRIVAAGESGSPHA
jgi:hypothetical protein